MIKRWIAMLAAAVMMLSMPFGALAQSRQVAERGGSVSNSAEGVTISKTLSQVRDADGNLVENFFDIELKVEIIEEILREAGRFDTEIAMVLDISNTMNADVGSGKIRMDLVREGMKSFVHNIAQKHAGQVRLSLIVFNTNAKTLVDGYTVTANDLNDSSDLQKIIKNLKATSDGQTDESDYGSSYNRFTNIEGGLQLAYNVLKKNNADQQYVILMSDGFPTTYNVNPGDQNTANITGFNPYMDVGRTVRKYSANYSLDSTNTATASATVAANASYNDSYYGYRGYFADAPFQQMTPAGTSYSDWGAYYAQRLAMHMKGYYKDKYANIDPSADSPAEYVIGKPDPNNPNRINIFTMGVSLGAQTIDDYQNNPTNVVDAMKEADLEDKTYPPLQQPSANTHSNHIIGEGNTGNTTNNDKNYENWLGYVIGGGQGFKKVNNGQQTKAYYNLNNSTDVSLVYDSILDTIEKINYQRIIDTMFSSDPMGERIEFVSLYDQNGAMAGMSLSGQSAEGGEDTASIALSGGVPTLNWTLGESGYSETTRTSGNTTQTIRTYELMYRVRLENEHSAFVEAGTANEDFIYKTNKTTTLTYKVDSNNDISSQRRMDFPIPAVKGYLGEFAFTKTDSKTGNAIANVLFTLRHNWDCPVCIDGMDQTRHGAAGMRGVPTDHVTVSIGDMTAYSNASGEVSFTDIPSGHAYTLYETMPDGYGQATEENKWPVVVDFDAVQFDGSAYDPSQKPTLTNVPQINMTHLQFKGTKNLLNVDGFSADDFRFQFTLAAEGTSSLNDISFESTAGTVPSDRIHTAYAYASPSGSSAGATGEVLFPLVHIFDQGTYVLTASEDKPQGGTDGQVNYTASDYQIRFTVERTQHDQNSQDFELHVTSYEVLADGQRVFFTERPDNATHQTINGLLTFENVHQVTGFQFSKLDEDTNRPVNGVEFTLEHNCGACDYVIGDMKQLSYGNGVVEFSYIPVGHSYLLTETKPTGYAGLSQPITVTIDNDGHITFIDPNGKLVIGTSQVSLCNTPNYYPTAYAFGGQKFLNGSTDFGGRQFTFELYELNAGVADWRNAAETDWTLLETRINGGSNVGSHWFRFSDIIVDDVGVYTYQIREQTGKESHMAYDSAVYTIVATATQGDLYHAQDYFNLDVSYQLYKDGTPVVLEDSRSMLNLAMHVELHNYYLPPETGDDTQLMLLGAALLLSGAGILLLFRRRKRAD